MFKITFKSDIKIPLVIVGIGVLGYSVYRLSKGDVSTVEDIYDTIKNKK